MQIMELVKKDIKPRDIMTEKAFMNALTVDMALGCSTNSMLHLPAIAREAGVELNVDIANEISARTPNLCHLAPAGHTYIEELNEAGGVYAVMNELNKKKLLNTDVLTVTGRTMAENIEGCVNMNTEVIRPIDNPYSTTGGIAVLKGNLAPDSCVVKRSAVRVCVRCSILPLQSQEWGLVQVWHSSRTDASRELQEEHQSDMCARRQQLAVL